MQLRTFQARTLREAIAQVRRELGPGAALLHTRTLRRGALRRLFAGTGVEVVATDQPPPALRQRGTPEPSSELAGSDPSAVNLTNRVAARLDELQTSIGKLPERSNDRIDLKPLRASLAQAELAPALQEELCEKAARDFANTGPIEEGLLVEHAVQAIANRLRVSTPMAPEKDQERPKVIGLVGPTGVGKTTTLAKLAASLSVTSGYRVGLITLDCYRVAAVDQLRTYADLLRLPLEVATDAASLCQAIDHLAECEVVLVDTEGRSPRDGAGIERLRMALDAIKLDATHLVVSAGSSSRGVEQLFRAFAPLKPTELLLTKLDEAPSLGHLVHLLGEDSLPLSYVTDGQAVPEDLAHADAERLARSVLAS